MRMSDNKKRIPDEEKRPGIAIKRVLVVDDDLETAVLLSLLLKRMGFDVITADNGPDGLGWCEKTAPDVVILDLGMPGMDGLDMCRLIRTLPWGQDARVIAVTAYGDAADRMRTQQAGFDVHLVKPVNAEDLSRAIGSPLGTRWTVPAGIVQR